MEVRKASTVLFVACLALLAAFCPTPSFSAPAPDSATVIAGIPFLPDLQFSQIPPDKRTKYDGDRFSYMAAGPKNAPVVLFLHGVGANSMHWRFQYPVFGEKYRVIAWNAPGYLMSNNLKPEAPTCEDYGEAVNDFLTSVGVGKVYLVANSFGTVVGQCFAARYPQKVTKIAFTGTLVGDAWRPEEQKKAAVEGRRKGIEGGSYAFGSGRVQALVGKNTSEDTLALLRSVLRAADLRGYMQAVAFVVGTDTRPLAPKLTMPIFMFQGTEDVVAPIKEHSYVLKPLLANAKLQEVPGVGHLPEFEVPDAFNKAVLDFFAQ